jgi:CCR4-NOT transcription complex subunit 6
MACKKKNEAIIATFSISGQIFTVINYHMPCAFNYPTVMRLHTEALITLTKSRAGNNPVILFGDFNSQPDSEVYRMITKEFKSVFGGKEPKFTNRSLYKYDNMTCAAEFTGTLDYIFVKKFDVWNKSYTPSLEDFPFIPTKGYPSDHIPIGATLMFSERT